MTKCKANVDDRIKPTSLRIKMFIFKNRQVHRFIKTCNYGPPASAARSGFKGIGHSKIRVLISSIVLNLPILICQNLKRLKKYVNLANFDKETEKV